MALPRWATGVAAQGLQWGSNVNQALGGDPTKGRAISSAIRDPNVVYSGGIGGAAKDLFTGNGGSFAAAPQGQRKNVGHASEDNTITETPPGPGNVLGAASGNAGDIAELDAQEGYLRSLLGRSQNYLNQGVTSLNDSYNREVSEANQGRSRTLEDLQLKREDTSRDKQSALGRVDTNARTLSDSVRRVLGQAGGSSSSAYKLAAPNAIARQASEQRGGVLGDYGENERNLALTERRATEDYDGVLEDLARSKGEREQELRSGILESEQGTLGKLAELARDRARLTGGNARAAIAPIQADISSRQSQLDSLFERFRSPALNAREVNVQAPTLRDYTVDRAAINANAGGASPAPYSPYSQFLRRPEDEERQY